MMDDNKDHRTDFIEYARPGTVQKERVILASGIVSLFAALFQLVWGVLVIAWIGWEFVAHTRVPDYAGEYPSLNTTLIFAWPGTLAYVFGCYSIWAAEPGQRNLCGILALVIVSIVAAVVIWFADWSPNSVVVRSAVFVPIIAISMAIAWTRVESGRRGVGSRKKIQRGRESLKNSSPL